MDALPTTLSKCSIVSVISNSKDAFGLTRAANHEPPIPATSFSPYNYQKLHPELFAEAEKEIKELGDRVKAGEEVKGQWATKKKELAARVKPLYQVELAKRVKDTKPDLIVLAGFMLILLPGTLETLVRDWVEEEGSQGIEAEGTLRTLGASPYPSEPTKGSPIPIINLHPALPGSFVGPHVIEDAWEAFNQRKLPVEGEGIKEGVPESAKSTPAPSTADPSQPIKDLADSLASTSLSSSSTTPAAPTATDEPSPFGPRITKTGIMIHRVIPELDRGEPVLWREIEMKEGESIGELKERIHKVEHGAIVDAVEQVTSELGSGKWWK